MCLIAFLYIVLLFFALVPGILLSLPPKGTKFVVAGVHAVVFGIVFHITYNFVNRMGVSLEGFTEIDETTASTTKPKKTTEPKETKETKEPKETTEPKETMKPMFELTSNE
jgi:hypothetical protein